MKKNILGLNKEELLEIVNGLGEKPFRLKQIWSWIYHKGAKSIDEMSDLSKSLREKIKENYEIKRPEITKKQISADGTRKWLIKFDDGMEVETVFIPEEDRGALCISCQVGCNMACTFCNTGTQKMVRNLTAQEIVMQIVIARDSYDDWNNDPERMITNIVMMGMGEPLQNYKEVAKALKIIMDNEGIKISKRHVTLSTCGIVPMIQKCGDELGVNLAISLHAPSNEIRNQIMPINKKYPLEELIPALKNYPAASNSRRITIEYVMIDGLNDKEEHARELVKLVKNLHVKFNLIPFNPWEGSTYATSSRNAQRRFAKILNDHGYSSPIRITRGKDIDAACGQLRSNTVKHKSSNTELEQIL